MDKQARTVEAHVVRQALELADVVGGRRVATPELRLMRAVLEDALRLVLEEAPVGRRGRAIRDQTARWIFENDLRWPFSFRNICQVLLVDPAEVRRRVRSHCTGPVALRRAA